MSPEQWERIQDVFEQGLGKTSAQQQWLVEQSGLDKSSASQLLDLWANADPPADFLEPLRPVGSAHKESPKPGEKIAERFTILECIGSGGMGEVYRARDERLNRIVALKVLREHLAADEAHQHRMEQEARAVSALSHPRICGLYDFGADNGLLYLVLEFLEGECLDARLRREPLATNDVLDIALQICEGLRHAHERGVVHRDLKPANVMLTRTGVKLLDFGIATTPVEAVDKTGPKGASELSPAGMIAAPEEVFGTPAYMSPEQRSGAAVDSRSDVFSLGALLYEMLEGRRALSSQSEDRPLLSVTRQKDEKRQSLHDIISTCLEPEPGSRYQSINDVERQLRLLTKPSSRRRQRLWLSVAGTCLVATVSLILWLTRIGKPGASEPRLSSLTAYPGTEYSPSISPDGKKVAFLWSGTGGDNFDVYVQEIGSDKPLRLTFDPGSEKWPQWSPDGRWIAFTRGKSIRLVSPSGGAERPVAEMAAVYSRCDIQFAWANDSDNIIFTASRPSEPPNLQAISLRSGQIRSVSFPKAPSGGDWCPAISPDGHRVLYTRRMPGKPDEESHWLARLEPNMVLTDDKPVPWLKGLHYAWAANGHEVIHPFNESTGAFLYRTDVDKESTPKRLMFGEEGMYPSIALRANRLVYMRRKMDIDIYALSLSPELRPTTNAMKFAPSTRIDVGGEYSPDGKQVAFFSDRSGRSELWIAAADSANPRRITQDAKKSYRGELPRWSPDGKLLLYGVDRSCFLVDIETGRTKRVAEQFKTSQPGSFSRDGQSFYISAAGEGKRPEIWRVPIKGGAARPIGHRGGFAAVESYDGSLLYFLRSDGDGVNLYVAPTDGEKESLIGSTIIGRVNLASTPRGLYFISAGNFDQPSTVQRYDPKTSTTTTEFQLSAKRRWTASGLSFSPDFKTVLYSVYDM